MRVVNLRKEKHNIYIGRGSVFGNPFIIGKDETREEVINKFEQYARKNKAVMQFIKDLHPDSILGCFCKPKACHGDVIIKIWKELNEF